MNRQEKILYHQIHPAKLFVDWSTGMLALFLLWQHALIVALIVMFIPSIIASLIIIQFINIEKYKQTAFGKYVSIYMTRFMEAIRFAGYAVMALGAWYHVFWLLPIGLGIIFFGWLRGVLMPQKAKRSQEILL